MTKHYNGRGKIAEGLWAAPALSRTAYKAGADLDKGVAHTPSVAEGGVRRRRLYAIEGEMLTWPQIKARCPGIPDPTIRARLSCYAPTWAKLNASLAASKAARNKRHGHNIHHRTCLDNSRRAFEYRKNKGHKPL